MLHVVIDTNVLVSALLSPGNPPSRILSAAMKSLIVPCFDNRILLEYEEVLSRPKFPFRVEDIACLLEQFREAGLYAESAPLNIIFQDETDRKFYEVAKFCGATLITGNIRHFPKNSDVLSPADFLAKHLGFC